MSATQMTAHERRVMKDALATIVVLAGLVEELSRGGTYFGADLRYVPPLTGLMEDIERDVESLIHPYPTYVDDDAPDDAIYEAWQAPLDRREARIRRNLRRNLIANDEAAHRGWETKREREAVAS